MLAALSPELKVLTLNAAALAVAYLGIYPSLRSKTFNRILLADLGVTLLVMGAIAALFAGSGLRFSMVFFHTNWFVFGLITFVIMETPLFLHFAKKHNIELFPGG